MAGRDHVLNVTMCCWIALVAAVGIAPGSLAQTSDLSVTANATGPFVPGTTFSCNYTLTNNGPDGAIGTTLSAQWPDVELAVAGFAYPAEWSCGADTFCSRAGAMPADSSEVINVEYYLPSDAHTKDPDGDGTFTICVDATALNDPGDAFNCIFDLPFTPEADLTVDVVAISEGVPAGGWALVEVVITNNGPSDVDGVSFASSIMGEASFGGLSPDRSDLYIPAGETRDYAFGVEVDDDAEVGSTITVGSSAFMPEGYTDLDPSNDSDTDTFEVIDALPPADVAIELSISPSDVVAGGAPTTVTLTVTNNGPGVAEGVSVHDLFFFPWQVDNIVAFGYALNGAFSAVRLEPMPAGAVDIITFELYVPASKEAGSFTDFAFVAADNPDPDINNNSDSAVYNVVREVDLSLDMVIFSPEVAPGGWGLAEVSVFNDGPSDVDGAGFVVTLAGDGSFTGLSADWGALYIPAGQTRTYLIGFQINESAEVGSVITLETSTFATGGYTEVNTENNSDTEELVVVDALPDADVEVVDVRLVSGDPLVPGSVCRFEIDAVNNGPADALGAVLTTLLFDVDYVRNDSTTPDGWNVAGSGGTWTRQTVWPVGLTQTFAIEAIVPPDAHYAAGLPIDDFRAAVAASNPDTNTDNNLFAILFDTQAEAALTIEKTLLNDGVAPGGTAFYDILVSNTGPSDVDGVAVVDTPGGNLDAASLVLSGDAADLYLPAGQSRHLMATVKVLESAAVGEAFANSAAVDASAVEPGEGSTLAPIVNEPETGAVTGTVGNYLAAADMYIAKTMSPAPATAGGAPIQVTLTVENRGPAPAEGVTVHDLFFYPWRVDNVSAPGYALNGGFSASRLVPMPAGATDIITFDLYVPASAEPRSYNNFAYVAADNPDPEIGNNASAFSYAVVGEATLIVEKSDLIDPVGQGQTLLYEIVVRNEGPTSMPGGSVEVVDTLPGVVQFLGASPGCVFSGPPMPNTGGTVTCTVDDILGINESARFLIQVRVPFEVPVGTILTNSATAGAPSLDPTDWTVTGGSDSTETEVAVGPVTDLRISKMVKPDGEVPAGNVFTYWIYVDNLGPSVAGNVFMIDEMISNGEFCVLSIESDRGGCAVLMTPEGIVPDDLPACSVDNELKFQCETSLLNPWDRWTIKVTAIANQTIDVNNSARVVALNPVDPNPENNYADGSINITDVADLALVKSAVGNVLGGEGGAPTPVANQVTAGLALAYSLSVTNNGPSTAANVVVSDQLPLGVDIVATTPSQGTVQLGIPGDPAAPVIWGVGTLAPGESASLEIQVVVKPNVAHGAILTNSAVALADTFDANIADNRAWNLTEVLAAADLSVSKEASPEPVAAGELLTYTITFENDGPSDAHGVAIVDTFPPEVEILSVDMFDVIMKSLDPRHCVVYTDRIICERNDVAVGEGGTIIIVARVPANTLDTVLTNEATVSARTADPVPANNSASAASEVVGCMLPAVPSRVCATNGLGDVTVYINWKCAEGAEFYEIYRGTTDDFASAAFLGATVETEFFDLDPEPPHCDHTGCCRIKPTVAYYWVVAVNECGESEPSQSDEGFERVKSANASSYAGTLIVLGLMLAGLICGKRTRNAKDVQ